MNNKNIYEKIFIHQGNDHIINMNYDMCLRYSSVTNKPSSGLWASTYTPGQKFLSAWDQFNKTNAIKRNSHKYVLFKLDENTKILELDKLDSIYQEYVDPQSIRELNEIEIKSQKLNSMTKNDNRDDFEKLLFDYLNATAMLRLNLNWPKIIKEFDGVYLPEGYIQFFRMWDVESLVLFNTNKIKILKNDGQ